MNLTLLLAKLKNEAGVELAEERKLPDGTKTFILVGSLPLFPHASRPTWYPLILKEGQMEVPRREVEVILRHFWHAEMEEDFLKGAAKGTAGGL